MNEYGLIKIFSQLYAGFQERARSEVIDEEKPNTAENYKQIKYTLGFLTPYEENAAGRKRQETVNKWAKESMWHYATNADGKMVWVEKEQEDRIKSRIIQNNQIEGFRLAEEIRRTYWGGGNIVWRIEDPRGFEIEISSANLARIIDEVGILAGGIIPGKCVYGRIGKDNIIIPEGTELWNRAVKDAEEIARRSKILSSSVVIPGAICEMATGDKMTYLGQMYITAIRKPEFPRTELRYNYYNSAFTFEELLTTQQTGALSSDSDRYHVFKDVGSGEGIRLYKGKSVISVTGTDDQYSNIEDNIKHVNVFGGNISFASTSATTWNIIGFVATIKKPEGIKLGLEKITEKDLQSIRVNESTFRQDIVFSGVGVVKNQKRYNAYLVVNENGEVFNSLHVLAQRGEEIKKNGGIYGTTYKVLKNNIKLVYAEKIQIDEQLKTERSLLTDRRSINSAALASWRTVGEESSRFDDTVGILQQSVEAAKTNYTWHRVAVMVNDSISYLTQ